MGDEGGEREDTVVCDIGQRSRSRRWGAGVIAEGLGEGVCEGYEEVREAAKRWGACLWGEERRKVGRQTLRRRRLCVCA